MPQFSLPQEIRGERQSLSNKTSDDLKHLVVQMTPFCTKETHEEGTMVDTFHYFHIPLKLKWSIHGNWRSLGIFFTSFRTGQAPTNRFATRRGKRTASYWTTVRPPVNPLPWGLRLLGYQRTSTRAADVRNGWQARKGRRQQHGHHAVISGGPVTLTNIKTRRTLWSSSDQNIFIIFPHRGYLSLTKFDRCSICSRCWIKPLDEDYRRWRLVGPAPGDALWIAALYEAVPHTVFDNEVWLVSPRKYLTQKTGDHCKHWCYLFNVVLRFPVWKSRHRRASHGTRLTSLQTLGTKGGILEHIFLQPTMGTVFLC